MIEILPSLAPSGCRVWQTGHISSVYGIFNLTNMLHALFSQQIEVAGDASAGGEEKARHFDVESCDMLGKL
jgi:hypothetical protein